MKSNFHKKTSYAVKTFSTKNKDILLDVSLIVR